jgi:uncharacterized protein (TIGR02757 family)
LNDPQRWALVQKVYQRLHHPRYLGSDPLQFCYKYSDPRDQEIVGLISASLALGQVQSITKAITQVLDALGPHPTETLRRQNWKRQHLAGFVYRFFRQEHILALFQNLGKILRQGLSLGVIVQGEDNLIQGLVKLRERLWDEGRIPAILLADPQKSGASKRWWMYLRWMVRKDEVDLGLWPAISPSELLYPVDTHIQKWGRVLGFSRRKTPDRRMSEEITQGFRRFSPEDPVKFDFSLTRIGILGLVQNWSHDNIMAVLEGEKNT